MKFHKIYDNQVLFLEKRDIDRLMEQYTDDAVLVRFDKTLQGKEELRAFFQDYLKQSGTFKLISTDKYTELADAIFFEATIEIQSGKFRVYDVFMLRNGKISHQFSGVIL